METKTIVEKLNSNGFRLNFREAKRIFEKTIEESLNEINQLDFENRDGILNATIKAYAPLLGFLSLAGGRAELNNEATSTLNKLIPLIERAARSFYNHLHELDNRIITFWKQNKNGAEAIALTDIAKQVLRFQKDCNGSIWKISKEDSSHFIVCTLQTVTQNMLDCDSLQAAIYQSKFFIGEESRMNFWLADQIFKNGGQAFLYPNRQTFQSPIMDYLSARFWQTGDINKLKELYPQVGVDISFFQSLRKETHCITFGCQQIFTALEAAVKAGFQVERFHSDIYLQSLLTEKELEMEKISNEAREKLKYAERALILRTVVATYRQIHCFLEKIPKSRWEDLEQFNDYPFSLLLQEAAKHFATDLREIDNHLFSILENFKIGIPTQDKAEAIALTSLAKETLKLQKHCKGAVWKISKGKNFHFLVGTVHLAMQNMIDSVLLRTVAKQSKIFIGEQEFHNNPEEAQEIAEQYGWDDEMDLCLRSKIEKAIPMETPRKIETVKKKMSRINESSSTEHPILPSYFIARFWQLGDIENLEKICEQYSLIAPLGYKTMVIDRNVDWVKNRGLFKNLGKKTTCIAVECSHLFGKTGMLRAAEKAGYYRKRL